MVNGMRAVADAVLENRTRVARGREARLLPGVASGDAEAGIGNADGVGPGLPQ